VQQVPAALDLTGAHRGRPREELGDRGLTGAARALGDRFELARLGVRLREIVAGERLAGERLRVKVRHLQRPVRPLRRSVEVCRVELGHHQRHLDRRHRDERP
jgi:hypothetical protein